VIIKNENIILAVISWGGHQKHSEGTGVARGRCVRKCRDEDMGKLEMQVVVFSWSVAAENSLILLDLVR
jgi:hypothetical protein